MSIFIQDKTEHDHQKQSSGTKSKQNDDGLSGSQSSSNQTRKVRLLVAYDFENYIIGYILCSIHKCPCVDSSRMLLCWFSHKFLWLFYLYSEGCLF